MKKFMTWLYILAKRQIKNPLFIALLLLFPLFSVVTASIPSMEKENDFIAGIYIEGNDPLAVSITEALTAKDDTIKFIEYDNLPELKRDVQVEKLVCAYVLPDNLTEMISGDDSESCIDLYIQPSTTIQPAINEILYSEIIKIYGLQIADEYVGSTGLFDGTDYSKDLEEIYSGYADSSDVFHLNYEEYGVGAIKPMDNVNKSLTFPVRGILSIMIFLAGMFGSIIWMRDRENGVFETITSAYRVATQVIYIIVPTILFAISTLITLYFTNNFTGFMTEVCAMLFFVLIITLFCLVLIRLLKQSRIMTACLPIFLLCCLIFCPVFINAANYIPAAKFIEKLFIPFYYLKIFI